jgi:mono/diheme cytochrome c family protein
MRVANFLAAAGSMLLFMPLAHAQRVPEAPPSPEQFDAGADLFRHICSHCHGPRMVNPGNGSFDLRKFPHDDRARFFNSVRNGKNSMPPWKDVLHPDEIEAVWAYIRTGGVSPEQPPLTVCLQANDPPLSFRGGENPGGFDLALSRIIAERLGRTLQVQWFVSRDDPDSNLTRDANALLSDGRCELLAEFPLTAGTLEPPHSPAAKLPPFDGAKPDDRNRWVPIGELAATDPYRLDTLTVILSTRHADRPIGRLSDLNGMRVGVQIATLADAIAMQYGDGKLIEHVVHLPDSRDLFEKLCNGDLDAAFVDTRAYDAWTSRHGSDGLAPSGYTHSLGFNMGFVALASHRPLVNQVDAVLSDLKAHDAIAPLAANSGLSFIPPRSPAVLADIHPAELGGD